MTWSTHRLVGRSCVITTLIALGLFAASTQIEVLSYVGFVVIALAAVLGTIYQSFRCPRCNELFFLTEWLAGHPFAKKCVHCEWPKGAPSPPTN